MEREFHRWLKSQAQLSPIVEVGIGDDAAILRGAIDGQSIPGIVVTTDAIADGTHFELGRDALSLIGRKAIAVNLSDIAAMGAQPMAALISLMLPRDFSLQQAQELFLGARQIANQYHTAIVGGDTNRWDGGLVVSVTLIGLDSLVRQSNSTWLLSGAKAGDLIVVSGSLGGSILGRHLSFEPRIVLAQYLVKHYRINAATDISDSLSLDIALMARAVQTYGKDQSAESGVELLVDHIPISEDAYRLAQRTKKTPLHHALTDGEDFELVMAIDPVEFERMRGDSELQSEAMKLSAIGRFIDQAGFWLSGPAGRELFEPKGYTH